MQNAALERANLWIDVSPLDTLIDYLRTAFPTRQMRAFRATDGSMRSEPMLDDEGNGVLCQEAVDARDELIERLCSIPPVPAALDFLLDRKSVVSGKSVSVTVDLGWRRNFKKKKNK